MYTLAIGMPGPFEWLIIGAIGLLLFGKRLPEVGRSVGKTIVEFKRGMKEVEQEVNQVDTLPPANPAPRAQIPNTQPHKFDPYTGKPVEQTVDATGSATHQA
ncbi:MAG TPA: twin-arginine translocase TatA/TatE family subunit [Tepidisphaeraceae bacterium]|jgi:sec-independent protein translocase protein TatA|nr:twin-arginine translocase TatA/TatE family subunit [Tepidisphaeraceae bacterium]